MRMLTFFLLLTFLIPHALAKRFEFRDGFEKGMATWLPPRPSDWEVAVENGNHFLRLKTKGYGPGLPRRPLNYALLKNSCVSDFTLTARLRRGGKSLLIAFAYQDTLHFNYIHLSVDRGTQQKVHNGIFRVDGGERFRIDDPDRPASLPDNAWHSVKVVREAGRISVYMDGAAQPTLNTSSNLFPYGRVGLGSFDETGDFDDVEITGQASPGCDQASMKLPVLASAALAGQAAPAGDNGATLTVSGKKQPLLLDFPGILQWAGYDVKQAALYFHGSGAAPRKLVISSVGAAWDESSAGANAAAITVSIFGAGGKMFGTAEARVRTDNWYRVPLDPLLVRAMIEGRSFGLALAVNEDAGARPFSVDSRLSKFAPYLELKLSKTK